jgi:hypothetical protein
LRKERVAEIYILADQDRLSLIDFAALATDR